MGGQRFPTRVFSGMIPAEEISGNLNNAHVVIY
jgi:hypothetical protein